INDLRARAQWVLASVRRGPGGDKVYPGSALSARGLCWAFVDRWMVLSGQERPDLRNKSAIRLADELWGAAIGEASVLGETNEAWRWAFGEVKSAPIATLNHIEHFLTRWAEALR